MKGLTLHDSGSVELRKRRIKQLEQEMICMQDAIAIMEYEIREMEQACPS